MTELTCSACSGPIVQKDHSALGNCGECGGLHSIRPIFRGDVPFSLSEMVYDCRNSISRYFDLDLIDSETGAIFRTHGWYDTITRKVVQFG